MTLHIPGGPTPRPPPLWCLRLGLSPVGDDVGDISQACKWSTRVFKTVALTQRDYFWVKGQWVYSFAAMMSFQKMNQNTSCKGREPEQILYLALQNESSNISNNNWAMQLTRMIFTESYAPIPPWAMQLSRMPRSLRLFLSTYRPFNLLNPTRCRGPINFQSCWNRRNQKYKT